MTSGCMHEVMGPCIAKAGLSLFSFSPDQNQIRPASLLLYTVSHTPQKEPLKCGMGVS